MHFGREEHLKSSRSVAMHSLTHQNPLKNIPLIPQRFLSVSAGSPFVSISLFIKAATQTDTDAHTPRVIGCRKTHCCQACSHHAPPLVSAGRSTDFSSFSEVNSVLNEVLLWVCLDLFQCRHVNTVSRENVSGQLEGRIFWQ